MVRPARRRPPGRARRGGRGPPHGPLRAAFPTAYEETFTVNQGSRGPRPPRPPRRRHRHQRRALPRRPTPRRAFAGSSSSASTPCRSPTSSRSSRTWASRSSTSSPSRCERTYGRPCTSTTSACACPRAATGRLLARADGRAFEDAFAAVWHGTRRGDGFNGLVLAAGLTWRQVVVLRAYTKYLRQAGATFSQEYLEDTLLANPSSPRCSSTLFEARFDPDRYAGEPRAERQRPGRRSWAADRRRARRRHQPRPRPDHPRASSASSRPACARTSTSRGADGAPKSYVSLKLDPSRCPTSPPPGRSSRSGSTARGSRASTCGSARSPAAACAGPTGARTSAPRSSGWSRRRWSRTPSSSRPGARAASTPSSCPTRASTARRGWPRASPHTRCSSPACSTSPTTGSSGRGGPAAGRRAARRPRHLPRRRGGQGHGDVLRHRQRHGAVATGSGSTTRSPRAARPATTTRRWGSPRGARGSRSSGTSARWTSTPRRRTSPSSASATCPVTCSATGCSSRSTSGSSRRSTTGTSSSTRRRTRRRPSPSGAGCSTLPRSSWADYDRSLISDGGGVFAAQRKSIPVSPEMADRAGAAQGHAHLTPAELIHAILLAPVDLLWNGGIGTYVKASTETTAGRRPRQRRDPRRRQGVARQGHRRGRQPRAVPAGPDRGGAQRGSGQHRRHRQLRRRRHLRPRGQHQDPAGRAGPRRRADHRAAQRDARSR